MLSPSTISTVKSTVPLLQEHGLEITTAFYELLFDANPQLRNIFNQANQRNASQSRALSDAVLAYASNIDNLEVLLPAVSRIANKHASIGIQKHHYPLVGQSLLAAIQQVLDLPSDHPALEAWGEAYGVLAEIFINSESELYDAGKSADGGWLGYRAFVIKDIRIETPDVKTLMLEPKDGKAVKSFDGGQYVSVKFPEHGTGFDAIRQYSLSDWGDNYRITVKEEPKGEVSSSIHSHALGDELLLSPPFGQFNLNPHSDSHVFISGGVGITPLFSMLKQAIAAGGRCDQLQFIECCRGDEHQIFREELAALAENSFVRVKRVFEFGPGGDLSGRLTRDVLEEWITNKSAQFYFCGPLPFMKELKGLLCSIGVKEDQLHYEVFGPTTEL